MKNKITFLATFIGVISLLSVNAISDEYALSQKQILEIENRVNDLPAFQLKTRKAQLLAEAQDLEDEQESSQSPARLRSISERMGVITTELSFIERAIGSLALLAIGNNVLNDGDKDSTAPVITVIGANPATVELGTSYSDAGATADTGELVSSSGSVDTNTVGTYTISYSAIDSWGNIGTATRTVNVVDTTAPVVKVSGSNPATVEHGAS